MLERQPAGHVVAVTGSVGTGTGRVLGILRRLGYKAIDAEEIAHLVTENGGEAYQQIIARFGTRYLDETGELDRSLLSQATRSDPAFLEALRSIIYPIVRQQLVRFIERRDGRPTFVRANDPDAYGVRELCDHFWVVTAAEDVRVANLMKDHGWPQAPASQFVRSQYVRDPQTMRVDTILCNTGSRADLLSQTVQALRDLGSEIPGAARTRQHAAPASSIQPAVRTVPVLAHQFRLVGREILNASLILLALAFLTSLGLLLAEYGRQHLPIGPGQAIWQAVLNTSQYFSAHPLTYYWARADVPWFQLVASTLGHSAGLLLLSMAVAALLGIPLGIAASATRSKLLSTLVVMLSVLGASTPSFLLAMLLWLVNISVHRSFNIGALPSTGFGWDTHLVMPVLVLAMRPLAQLAQVTYVNLSEVLQQDYIRTGYSKGLNWRAILNEHALPNVMIPILNTLGTSLRFSLASVPVVEVFFRWPGIGSMLLDAINAGTVPLVLDLILALGLFFLAVNLLIELSYPFIDPRLRREALEESRNDRTSWRDALVEAATILADWPRQLRQRLVRRGASRSSPDTAPRRPLRATADALRRKQRAWILRNLLRNPTLIASSLVVLFLIGLAAAGASFTKVSPYEVHGVMSVDGEFSAPPFKPSSVFPWGTDHIGRDIQALVLAGGQKTLSLAFFGMLARLLLGSALGVLAGWQRGGRFDRLVTGAMGVWAAFPATLFAMIVIQALGIQQGMSVFIAAICIVGWGEVAQFVRGQVILLKPRLFVEAARSVGARTDQILLRHIIPNLVNPIIVLASLEMGAVLMLLAELGFLNVFMGGGFQAMIAETGAMQPVIASYSDVPEWGALIANVRAYWRSYPWMALYPGLAILISIISFNLFGEGLRRFLDESSISLSRFLNRYTFAAIGALAVVVALVLQSARPLSVYRGEGMKFDPQRVANDIRVLSSPQLQGRETGTDGASLAALYLAQRMAEIGLFPAGEHHTYFQRMIQPRLHMQSVPTLALVDASGDAQQAFSYRQDFVEMPQIPYGRGEAQARVMGAAYGPLAAANAPAPDLRDSPAAKHILIVRADDLARVKWQQLAGVLVVSDDASQFERHDVFPIVSMRAESARPYMLISPQVADLLLQTAGSSLAELDAIRAALSPGEMQLTREGQALNMSVPALDAANALNEAYVNVIGVIPGQGAVMGLEEQVIVVGAYYDGVGTDPTGLVYQGANDNASGVAMMLELARLLKQSTYQPDKTVLFVAWAGGERQEGLSVVNVLNARPGASDFNVEAILELSGVSYGTGKSVSMGSDSSYRLVQLFQQAAGRYRVPTTTRGRGPHYDLPSPTIFGGRDAMTLSLSWDGSDENAHTPRDTFELVDPDKIRAIGRPAYLTLLVLCRETEY